MSDLQSIARLASVVYAEPPPADDPAELYHEASKLAPVTAARQLAGGARLAALPDLQRTAARASSRHPQRPLTPLPRPSELGASLGAALATRRSARAFAREPLGGGALAALLRAGYGVSGTLDHAGDWEQPLRSSPSAGALYPLDLYVSVVRVDGLTPGLYRYEPLENGLEPLGGGSRVAEATAYPELAADAGAVVVITATFWRSRFKYGQRAYRFALLEAGHVAQNLLLAAAALELAAVPLGGFFDYALDDLLGLDGVNRSSLYLVCVGAKRGPR